MSNRDRKPSQGFSNPKDAIVIEELIASIDSDTPPPNATQLAQLSQFAELTALWNRRLNLTGPRTARPLVEITFADAMILAQPEILPEGAHVLDVGAGAGAPGLPLLILRPDLRLTLLEPIQKRVAFMRTAIGMLDLMDRTTLCQGRVEDWDVTSGAAVQVAMSRATFAPDQWLECARELAPEVLVLAGDTPLPEPDWADLRSWPYRLPFSGAQRSVGRYRTRVG